LNAITRVKYPLILFLLQYAKYVEVREFQISNFSEIFLNEKKVELYIEDCKEINR